MVLESLVTPFRAEKKPWQMFFYGLLFTVIGVLLSLLIFSQHIGLIMLFLIVISCVPLMVKTLFLEEKKESLKSESKLLAEHSKVILFLSFLFLGFVVAFTLMYVFLPSGWVTKIFDVQTKIMFGDISGASTSFTYFKAILLNNIRVTIFSFILALLYGAGAIFIFTWNASIIGVAIGNLIRTKLNELLVQVGFLNIGNYFHIFSLGFLRYLTHGVFEMSAYFIAGLAGGIISVAIVKHDLRNEKFNQIVQDSGILFVISLITLVVAAVIEVYVSFGIA